MVALKVAHCTISITPSPCYESESLKTKWQQESSKLRCHEILPSKMVHKLKVHKLLKNMKFFKNSLLLSLILPLKATIHGATLLLATVVTRLWQPCSRVVTAWLQPGYNCCKQQSCPVYGGLNRYTTMCVVRTCACVLLVASFRFP